MQPDEARQQHVADGDPGQAGGAVVGFTIYKATDKLVTEKTLSPKPENVEAARGT